MTPAEEAAFLAARAIVEEQAKDEALWSRNMDGTLPISEAYLQQELRRLHAAIEGISQEECARRAIAALAAEIGKGGR